MPFSSEQLRTALKALNGQRRVQIYFSTGSEGFSAPLVINSALLVPAEGDEILKLTDGNKEYLIDAERVTCIEII